MTEEDLETMTINLRTVSLDSDDSTLKQRMHLAIQSYNQKSKQSNLRLLSDCVSAISSLNLPTEQEKLNRIAHILCVRGVFSLDYDRRGLCPFEAPVKEEVSREKMRDHLVCDNECLLDLEHEDVEHKDVEQKDVAAREEMHETLEWKNKAPKEATVVNNSKARWVDLFAEDVLSRLDVLGGFQFGWSIGLCKYQPIEQWHSYYLFCRYKPDAEEEEDAPYKTKDHTHKYKDHKTDAGWAWRVVIHLESDGNEGIDYPTRIFDSIVGYLDWYGSWYERLDLEDFLEDLVEDYEFGD
ncbi:hypothetical protein KCU98_g4492, partial [Aureobasidium melanogenum]